MKLNRVGTKKKTSSTAYAGARNHIGCVRRPMERRRLAAGGVAGGRRGADVSIAMVIGDDSSVLSREGADAAAPSRLVRQKPAAPAALASWANWSWVVLATFSGVIVPAIMSARLMYRSGLATPRACIDPTEVGTEALTSRRACGTPAGVGTLGSSDTVLRSLTKPA